MKLEQAKILIGDDSILARKQLKDMISLYGRPEFLDASNGEEAVKLAIERKPELIFLDIVMPVKDGITAIREIRAAIPDADVIMVSSVGTQDLLKSAIEEGAKDFIQKPLNPDQIKTALLARFEGR